MLRMLPGILPFLFCLLSFIHLYFFPVPFKREAVCVVNGETVFLFVCFLLVV